MQNDHGPLRLHLVSGALTLLVVLGMAVLANQPRIKHLGVSLSSYKETRFEVPYAKEKGLISDIRLNSGELNLFSGAKNTLVAFTADYRFSHNQPVIKLSKDHHALTIRPKVIRKLDISGRSVWNLALNPLVAHTLEIRSNASRQNFNFSDIPIKKVSLISGANRLRVFFEHENPIALETFTVKSKASDCKIEGILNGKIRALHLQGAGRFWLSFTGIQKASTEVTIHGSVNRIYLVIPKSVNAKLVFQDTPFKTYHIDGFYKASRWEYRSDQFDPKKPILTLFLFFKTGSLVVRP